MKAKEMAAAANTLRYMGLTGTADTLDDIGKKWPLRKLDAASVRNMVTMIVYSIRVIPTPGQFFNDNDKGDNRIGISWKYKDDSDYKIIFNSDNSADFSAKANDGSGVHAEGRLHAAEALAQLLKFLETRKDDLKQAKMKELNREINDMTSRTDNVEQEVDNRQTKSEQLKQKIEERSQQKAVAKTKDTSKQEAAPKGEN